MPTATPTALNPALATQIATAASAAGVRILSAEPVLSFNGEPTTRFALALTTGASSQSLALQLSDTFQPTDPDFAEPLAIFLAETANRLRTAVPAALLTLTGIPLTFTNFAWPFHESTAGADTSVVHGQVNLADTPEAAIGAASVAIPTLHAKISAAMTVTFRDVVRAPEQPFAETFILNAVRKTMDQGQLELVKSGNRQPVPVTTRYYSTRYQRFVFNDTTEPQRRRFLAAKTFWLSGILGAAATPVWLLDPRDAQYLNATVAELKISVEALAKEGTILLAADPAFATPSPTLLARQPEYQAELAHALTQIKPTFNEDMRGGHTNM